MRICGLWQSTQGKVWILVRILDNYYILKFDESETKIRTRQVLTATEIDAIKVIEAEWRKVTGDER